MPLNALRLVFKYNTAATRVISNAPAQVTKEVTAYTYFNSHDTSKFFFYLTKWLVLKLNSININYMM